MSKHLFRIGAIALILLPLALLKAEDTPKTEKPQPAAPPADDKPVEKPADVQQPAAATVEQIVRQARDSVVVVTFTGRDGKQQGLGAGFIVSADGLIATNLHVIGEARPIAVQLADGRKFDVTAVHASDRALDLALVRIDAKDLPALPLGDSDKLAQGEAVVALGNPHGLKHSVVSGVVSGRREVEGRNMIQLAMPIEPGNSGGPLLDMHGRVHGLVTMKSLVTENLGFAVEVNDLKPLLAKPNPVPMSRWLTIGMLDPHEWTPLLGARWQQRSGRIVAGGMGDGFGGRSLCLFQEELPKVPFELGVTVRLDNEAGAAGLIFHSDGGDKHYGFYPSAGKIRLSRFEGPSVFTWKVLYDEPSPHYRPGQWNHLKVRFEIDKMQCYVNDELVLESTDDVLPSGKVGLAAFRGTEAQFKGFQLAPQIPSSQMKPETAERLQGLIEKLPVIAELAPDALAGLSDEPAASALLLRDRAKELEQRAQELRRVANDLHSRRIAADLVKLFQEKDEQADLLRAALLIARLDNEDLEIETYVKQVDRMAADIRKGFAENDGDAERLAALDKYLFTENGFHGSRTDYYHRANSHLNQVIDDREGLPITLSVLYIELARRIGLNVQGVGLPGHFVVKHVPEKGDEQLIDVFVAGKRMTREDAERQVRFSADRQLLDGDLAAASKQSIVVRMLGNLLGVAQDKADKEAMLRYLEAVVAIHPASIPERGMRAVLRYETGRRDAAIADLDWFLDQQPAGLDLARIREMREHFQTRAP
jgi:serine protease Do